MDGKLSDLTNRLIRFASQHPFAACGIIGFLSGGLLDIDHILLWIFHVNYPIIIHIDGHFELGRGRNLQGLALIVGGLVCTYAGGSLFLMVLEETADKIKEWIQTNLYTEDF